MEDKKSLLKWEKYTPWLKFDRWLAGPILVLSLIYILFYIGITVLIYTGLLELAPFGYKAHLVGGGVFLVSSVLAFSGYLMHINMLGGSSE